MSDDQTTIPLTASPASVPVLDECRPIFLTGMNGSGTTMLRECLGRHPDIYGFPRETRLLPHLIATLDALGDLDADDNFRALWNRVLEIPAFVMHNGGKPPPLPDNWRDFPRRLQSVVDAVMRGFAAREGKTRWCEKTPQHVQHLPELHVAFPGAYFIHITRDGRDCAASFHRRWRRRPELTIYRWKKVVAQGRNDGRALGDRYFELKYEDLTTNPEIWMRSICEFIDVPFVEDVLVSAYPHQKDKKGSLGRIEPNTGKWRAYFSAAQVQRLERIAGAYLAELDYPSVTTQGSQDPPKTVLDYWRFMNYLKQYWIELTGRAQGKTQKRWGSLIRMPLVALRQWRTNKY